MSAGASRLSLRQSLRDRPPIPLPLDKHRHVCHSMRTLAGASPFVRAFTEDYKPSSLAILALSRASYSSCV